MLRAGHNQNIYCIYIYLLAAEVPALFGVLISMERLKHVMEVYLGTKERKVLGKNHLWEISSAYLI